MSQSVLCPVLIGRASELALLEERLRQAAEGTGRAVLVTGDAGIGKSRLVAELVGKAAAGGAQVLTGACTEGELTASFLPFVEQTARYLGGQQERSPNLAVDSFTDLRAAREQGKSVEVIDPTGARPLNLKEAATAQSFQLTQEGFYEIHRANGRQELIAVHADRRESDLAPIPADVLQLWRNTGTPAGPDTNTTDGEKRERSWGLWRRASSSG